MVLRISQEVSRMHKRPISLARLRTVPHQFSWVDQRLVQERYIDQLSHEACALYPYSDTYMNMLCNTTSCGHFKHSCPWSLAPVKPPFCRGKFWQCTQVSL